MATKKCPACAEKIQLEAVKCKHCGHEIQQSEADQAVEKARARNLGCAAVVGVIVLIIALGGNENSNTMLATELETTTADLERAADQAIAELNAEAGATSVDAGNPPEAKTPSSKWSYRSYRDEVRGGQISIASIRSDDTIDLSFPYQGAQPMILSIRKHPAHGLDVFFNIDRGQMLCRPYNDCRGTINFDGHAERLSLLESDDNDSTVMFATYGNAILNKIKNSKKVIVEIPFYQNGNQHVTFSTDGLQWPVPK